MKSLDQFRSAFPKVVEETEAVIAREESKPNRINGIVRNLERVYRQTADSKSLSGIEEPPVRHRSAFLEVSSDIADAIDWRVVFLTPIRKAARMIAVLVGKDYPAD